MKPIVEPTEANRLIYSKLCELDSQFQASSDENEKRAIISEALTLCKDLEGEF